ncbi:signal peptide peptidase SppA [Geoalkalibacter subterraneus]|jgi:protease-4|uniref:Multidrug transporter n=1 Tax=Geoalkalibacter subterraneus TaxID=483547 RepID=A0A0B5FTJ0_9BACT|nr:signal peptide peptidase SppA [Geoalkalibacter subterraneus]AJF06941.1 multidrug transporter [Geoalkalibacter subterraneus]
MNKKRPFLMALATFGAIFIVFFILILVFTHLTGRSIPFPSGDRIGVVQVLGPIVSSDKLNRDLIRFREDPSIKAIVLRVDSPGGGVGPSQEIHDEVAKTVKEKPVVVSMASVAASGGYYIAAPASSIVANPGSITGSIGVIMEFTNIEDLLDKVGLKTNVIKSGPHKDIGSPVRPMDESDRVILQNLIQDVHNQFIDAVAEGRDMERTVAAQLADGRIYTGKQALDLGLIDRLGNLQVAVDLAAELSGVEGEPQLVYPEKEKPRLVEFLIQETMGQLRQEIFPGLQYRWNGL